MKVHKVPQMNPKTQQKGYATRAVLNGQESWDDLIEMQLVTPLSTRQS